MWSKISNALKTRHAHEDPEPPPSQHDVLTKVFEQHPNLSVFHNASDLPIPAPSPPSSPSKHVKRGMFKRMSKVPPRDDADSLRAPSPMTLPINLPKKVKSPFNLNGNGSQLSLSRNSPDITRPSQDIAHPLSQDMSRSSHDSSRRLQDTSRTSAETLRRPSLDMLRLHQAGFHPIQETPHSEEGPLVDVKFGSVRSILRDPNTPGTGQNVRFFSRDAYKVISPDESTEAEEQLLGQSHKQLPNQSLSFIDRLNQSSPESATPAVVAHVSSQIKPSRPSVAEIFSPLNNEDTSFPPQDENLNSRVPMSPIPPPDFTNLLDMSQHLALPAIPPGLGFDLGVPLHDSPVELETDGHTDEVLVPHTAAMTSTPYRDKGKAKANVSDKENVLTPIDETIFHAKEKSPHLPSVLHDRSQSFSFGQTVFFSVADSTGSGSMKSSPHSSVAYSSADTKSHVLNRVADSPARSSPMSLKGRSRAMSDTAFQAMLRSSPKPPEADINDESSSNLIVYSGEPAEPDPFRANATTYYTPQTMIPVTPPQGPQKHTRKTSKEENLIFSLQTQLTLQTELCGQYETDLRMRDELVEILQRKINDIEKEESKRKSALRIWKKKVAELEKACRYLGEEVEGSRQESMERSIMDEASGEALRMLHRQIASLERERSEWTRREDVLTEEVETLEGLVKERSEDVMSLKEVLWNRDESERELKEGIREAKEQMELMGNISVGLVDEEDLKKLVAEKEHESKQERERHRVAQTGWEEEKTELIRTIETLKTEKLALQTELEGVRQQLRTRDEDYGMLKAELEAQWRNTEKDTEKIKILNKEAGELEKERDALEVDLKELERKVAMMEVDWNDGENKKAELENELQEVWNYKEALEKERGQLEDQLQHECDRAEELTRALQEGEDRHALLEQERQFALDNVTRLEEKLRLRDEAAAESSQRIMERELQVEQLREEMSFMKREHSHVVEEQARALQEVSLQEGQTKAQMDTLVRQKAEADVETRTSRERVTTLKDEVERLRKQVHELQQESADKEVKIVQVMKQRAQDKDDLQGLNIALDSKQQELELLKRRLGLRGTAGSTPAQASKVSHRRESIGFNTPNFSRPPSRPSSVLSNSSKEGTTMNKQRKPSTESISTPSAKVSTLGKSARVNATPSSSTSKHALRGIEGSMGPPPTNPRLVAGTPTPSGRISSLSRPSTIKPLAQSAIHAPHRRVSSVTLEQSQSRTKISKPVGPANPASSDSKQGEKENVDVSKRRNMVPTPA